MASRASSRRIMKCRFASGTWRNAGAPRAGELNAAIALLLERLAVRTRGRSASRVNPGSRRSLFEQLDRPALRPLPTERYVFAQWKKVRVNIDYHVEVERHYYSVPHALVGRQLAGEPRLVPKLQPAVARRGRPPARANSFSTEGVSRLRHGSCDTKR